MTIDIADVCTDADLEKQLLGASNLLKLIPDEWDGEATIARQEILDRVLSALVRRRPPIRDTDIVDPSELKTVVMYGTLEMLYLSQATHEESPFMKLGKHYGQRFSQELNSLQPTVHAGVTTSSLSVRISRG
jgi:hypothetical protein